MIWIAAGASYAVTLYLLWRCLDLGAREDKILFEVGRCREAYILWKRRSTCGHLATVTSLLTLFLIALGILT
jgi:hypothetical protein